MCQMHQSACRSFVISPFLRFSVSLIGCLTDVSSSDTDSTCDATMAGTVIRSTKATTASGRVSVSRSRVDSPATIPEDAYTHTYTHAHADADAHADAHAHTHTHMHTHTHTHRHTHRHTHTHSHTQMLSRAESG